MYILCINYSGKDDKMYQFEIEKLLNFALKYQEIDNAIFNIIKNVSMLERNKAFVFNNFNSSIHFRNGSKVGNPRV